MGAVYEDQDWMLYHESKPRDDTRGEQLKALDFVDEDTGKQMYVYSIWRARELWDMITRNTYEYSEPGIIFIDRVNDFNNLNYCETIRCTNPCGEQPLPPHGTCNLLAVNVAFMVKNAFSADAEFDWELLAQTVILGQRFLDNVIDVTRYPLPEQEAEEKAKRRIGLGKSGLASAMAQLGLRYGSSRAAQFEERVMRTIATATYEASVMLACERGAFPLYSKDEFWNNPSSFVSKRFADAPWFGWPIRNGVNNTVAPTGTTSIVFGNIESGVEPTFRYEYNRRVTRRDGGFDTHVCKSFTAHLWDYLYPGEPYPKHFVEANDLAIHEHIRIQEACQKWTDASISKTINIPEDMPYEDFLEVYDMAWQAGLKGCTTYRPSLVRGSILSDVKDESNTKAVVPSYNAERPEILNGMTSKVRWPALNAAAYITLNRLENGEPFEVFLASKDQRYSEWMTTTTLLMSWLLRLGVPLDVIAEELKKVSSMEGYIVDRRYRPSFVSLVGARLQDMDLTYWDSQAPKDGDTDAEPSVIPISATSAPSPQQAKAKCPKCGSPNLVVKEGCISCPDCGESKCG